MRDGPQSLQPKSLSNAKDVTGSEIIPVFLTGFDRRESGVNRST